MLPRTRLAFPRAFGSVAQSAPIPPPAVVHLPLTRWPDSSTSNAVASTSQSVLPPSSSTSSAEGIPDGPAYVTLPSHIFSAPSRPDILHQCVVAHLASLRQGTAKTKNRSEVKGSTRKIMRQKGTGKARVGDIKSPIRRGGGRAFPKIPRDWTLGLNRKVWELGLRTALSERWRRNELSIIPTPPSFPSVSTRSLVDSLRASSFASSSSSKTLFLLSSLDSAFALSARNLPNVEVELVDDVDVYPLLQGNRVVLDMEAVQYIEDRLGRAEEIEFDEDEEDYEGSDAAYFASAQGEGDGQTDPQTSGGIKEQDVVVEGEEAGVQEQRHPHDPLADGKDGSSARDEGDKIREHMEELAKEGNDKLGNEDRPSAKDVL